MKAKKSLGQNFLKCTWVINSIVKNSEIDEKDIVLEIGPGKGILTEKILQTGATIIAVEKDDRLIPFLQEKFKSAIEKSKLFLIHADILEIDLEKLNLGNNFSVIANIPYYITGQLIRKVLENKNQPEKILLMLQKEVVTRIIANDNKQNLLSLSVNCYGQTKKIIDVPKNCFTPVPNVDSSVIKIFNISKDYFEDIKEDDFFRIIKIGFGQKRKQLGANLAKALNIENSKIKEILVQNNLSEKIRAEDLNLNDWKNIIPKIMELERVER